VQPEVTSAGFDGEIVRASMTVIYKLRNAETQACMGTDAAELAGNTGCQLRS